MADGVAGAIIEFVVKGSDVASAKADQVKTDLTSAERAGQHAERASKSAEGAAHKAERATEDLQRSASHALSMLRRSGGLANHLLGSGSLLGELGAGAGVAGHAFHLLEGLASFVPGGSIIAGGVSLAAGLYEASQRQDEDEERSRRDAERIAQHLDRINDGDINAEMLRQVGLTKLDRAIGGSRLR